MQLTVGTTSVVGILMLIALVLTLIHAINGKIPLWISVLLIEIAIIVGVWMR